MASIHVLGVNSNVHVSAAALLTDGQIVAAAQEERFSRSKHTGKFPEQAILYCLQQAGLRFGDVSAVGFYWRPWRGLFKRACVLLKALPRSLAFLRPSLVPRGTPKVLLQHVMTRQELVRRFGYRGGFYFLQHCRCHAASAFYPSPFETAAILSLDLSGEIESTFAAFGAGNRIDKLWSVPYPHSLGSLYAAITQYLGFSANADEHRVMGLASYGEPRYYQHLKGLVQLLPGGKFRLDLDYFTHHWGADRWYSDKLVSLLGPARRPDEPPEHQRFADVARSAQVLLEEVCLHIGRALRQRSKSSRLCLAGGVALNGVMNQRLLETGVFDELFVPPAPHDCGTSVGAALLLWHGLFGKEARSSQSAYLGPAYDKSSIEVALRAAGVPFERCTDPAKLAADAIAAGQIVGWFQGRMEFGARALGNRSILADPRNVGIKRTINEAVKYREPFRPFAGSVLEERYQDYFDLIQPSPYMLQVCRVKPSKRATIPGVTHVDGTCRPQTVRREQNPLFWKLLVHFEERTGVPIVLNTSFNVAGEPIVCSPVDAVRCFLRSGIGTLVMDDFVTRKRGA